MSRYIDADKLIAEIKRRIELLENGTGNPEVMKRVEGVLKGYNSILSFIDSLQQEQPDKYEIALAKAREWMPKVNQGGHAILISIFQELGEGLDPRYGGRKQEQPEVELEKEIDEWLKTGHITDTRYSDYCDDDIKETARHFYELGLKARK